MKLKSIFIILITLIIEIIDYFDRDFGDKLYFLQCVLDIEFQIISFEIQLILFHTHLWTSIQNVLNFQLFFGIFTLGSLLNLSTKLIIFERFLAFGALNTLRIFNRNLLRISLTDCFRQTERRTPFQFLIRKPFLQICQTMIAMLVKILRRLFVSPSNLVYVSSLFYFQLSKIRKRALNYLRIRIKSLIS